MAVRTEVYQTRDGEWVTRVVLSRRNLLSLLAKLDGHPPDSACTISGPEVYPATAVVAEEDDAHYAHFSRGGLLGRAGRMHPDTEAALPDRPDTGGNDDARGWVPLPIDYVFVHGAECNDYTGCSDDCGSVPRDRAEWRDGCWRALGGGGATYPVPTRQSDRCRATEAGSRCVRDSGHAETHLWEDVAWFKTHPLRRLDLDLIAQLRRMPDEAPVTTYFLANILGRDEETIMLELFDARIEWLRGWEGYVTTVGELRHCGLLPD